MRLEKFLEACDCNKDMKQEKKRKRKGKTVDNAPDNGMSEAKVTLVFGGYHLKDNILDDITVEELQEMVQSNIPSDKIDARAIQKEYDTLLKMKLNDAREVLRKIIPDLVKDFKANKE